MFASLSDAGVLIPPPTTSSLVFDAALSVAVELERQLGGGKLHDPNNARAAKRADGSPTELPRNSPALPTGGAAKHHEDATTTDESLNESDHSSTCGVSRGEENASRARDEDDDVEDDEEDGNGTEDTPVNNSLNYSFEWEGHLTKEEGSNGQRRGKTKTYRCKQCSFVATVKTDFWAHNKTHIKAEKLLTCPTCPFVTEYKHHLEYHLRNHYGSKPFKCSQCAYSCVNKSMLNSHLKSHSNVYQFRCADCNYATKYCHSLKLHLRKYSHKAATALAQDGSPNQVVDVFGSRRSSKNNKKNNNNTITEDSTSPLGHLHFVPPPLPPLPLPQLPPLPFLFPVINGYHSTNYESHLGVKNGETSNHKTAELKCNLCEFTALGQEHLSKHMLAHAATENQDLCSLYGISSDALLDKKNNTTELYLNAGVRLIENKCSIKFPSKPLDLSQRETKKEEEEESVPMTTQRHHRRKGKAFKLDRLFLRLRDQTEEEEEEEYEEEQLAIRNQRQQQLLQQQQQLQQRRQQYQHDVDDEDEDEPPSPPPLLHANGKEVAQLQNINNNNNECPYCEIIFKDSVMYAVHMGYHGYKDPFQCNMCGQTSDDKVSFFLHIARNAHK